jgi:hypothetical protein
MNRRATMALVMAVLACVFHGCGDGNGGSAGSGGTGGSGPIPPPPEFGSADRASISYADNLLQKVEDEEWTLGEGLVATLQAFAGERDEAEVLRYPELNSYEATGVFLLAQQYLEDGPDAEAQSEIARLLRSLLFSIDELEEMAGLSSTTAALVTKQATERCDEFFKDVNPDDQPMGVGPCLEVESVTIDGKEHRIFFPAEPLPTAGWDETSISMVIDTLADAIPVYDAIGDIPAISIVFSANNHDTMWGASVPNGSGECAIVIFTGLQSEPQERFQQLVAHEIAHCFQGETWPGQHLVHYDVIKWHFEGAAEYWSNLVYPDVNLEWRHLPGLEQVELVTYLHNRSYENFIFFQYLGSTIGNDGIAALIGGLPTATIPGDPGTGVVGQREGLAAYPNMEQIFHDFTKALTDGAVQDTSGAPIPYAAPAYEVELFGPQPQILHVPLLFPFATYRFLLVADEDEQVQLSFREAGTLSTSARRSTEGVATGHPGLVTESVTVAGLRPWSSSLPTELPEEECDSAARLLVATSSKSPSQDSLGELSGASLDLDVTDVDNIECCLHGQWLMNNEDLAAADTEGIGVPTSYSGQLTADYRHDGTVLFLWAGLTRVFEDQNGPVTAVINGGGAQFYEVPREGLLVYSGPELTVDVEESAPSGQSASFRAVLDTALGDYQSTQFFECTDDALMTVIRGDDEIGWRRITNP